MHSMYTLDKDCRVLTEEVHCESVWITVQPCYVKSGETRNITCIKP